MKEMKTLYKSLMAFAASLLLIPAAMAQTVPYYVNETNGIAYNKYIKDGPDENGQYTLHIETFATGEVTVDTKVVPSDVVLVLDNSGSMYQRYILTDASLESQLVLDRDFNCYTSNNAFVSVKADGTGNSGCPVAVMNTDNPRYILYDGNYCIIEGGGNTTSGYYLRFKPYGSTTYKYLDNTSVVDEMPTTYKLQNLVIYREKLYSYPTRKYVLNESVKRFIQLINENNETLPLEEGQMGNRIAIVAFGNVARDYPSLSEYTGPAVNPASFVLKGFTPVANLAGVDNPLAKMSFNGYTTMDFGTNLARRLLEAQEENYPVFDDEGEQVRARSVILFTDGAPNHNQIGASGSLPVVPAWTFWQIATACVNDCYTMKNDLHAKFFSIALSPAANYVPFMEHMSSNYPKARTTLSEGAVSAANRNSYSGDIITPAIKQIYYMDAGKSDLTKIFEAIASYTGGGNTDVSSTSIAAIDLVADSFILPEGVSVDDVKVYTAQCLGVTGESWTDSKGNSHPYLAFAEPVSAEGEGRDPVASLWVSTPVVDEHGDPVIEDGKQKYQWTEKKNVDIDGTLSIVPDTDNNTVTVTGFNYGDNWCGLDPDPDHINSEQYNKTDYTDTYVQGYRGFKIIFEFPIQAKDGALGGANVPTNLDGSGLYDKDGNTLAEYPKPTLPIPVNLWIKKTGLKQGESATFTIFRKLIQKVNETDPDPDYEKFAQVIITGEVDSNGNIIPVVKKLLNLDPSYYYKIFEEGWSWAYSNQAQAMTTAPSTEDPDLSNPIQIDNTYDNPVLKHAEAKAVNVMKQTGSSTETVQDVK